MTHALLLLAATSLLQVPDTSTYADTATETLIVQARGRHAYHDSLIRDYSALVQTRIDVGFGRSRFARVPPIVAHETAARITWALPNDLKVDVVGQRAVSIFPGEDFEAEFDRPWFVPRGLGDSIRMVDDEIPTTAALHQLADGAEEFYRYAIVDSMTLVIPGRTVRAINVRVEPKESRHLRLSRRS